MRKGRLRVRFVILINCCLPYRIVCDDEYNILPPLGTEYTRTYIHEKKRVVCGVMGGVWHQPRPEQRLVVTATAKSSSSSSSRQQQAAAGSTTATSTADVILVRHFVVRYDVSLPGLLQDPCNNNNINSLLSL